MDDLDRNNSGGDKADEPIYFDDDDVNQSRRSLAGDSGEARISHAPLDLGGGDAVEIPKAAKSREAVKQVSVQPVVSSQAGAVERITGLRTFFTKLHAGALDFLTEQIGDWLKKNPDIVIKRTNMVTGDVIGKKTEPNLIITVWY